MPLTYEQATKLAKSIKDDFKQRYGLDLNATLLDDLISDAATFRLTGDDAENKIGLSGFFNRFQTKAELITKMVAGQIAKKAIDVTTTQSLEYDFNINTFNGLEEVFQKVWNVALKPQLNTKVTPTLPDLVKMNTIEKRMNYTRIEEAIDERKAAGTYHVDQILAETNDLMDRFDAAMQNHQNNGRGGYDVHLSSIIASMEGNNAALLNQPLNDEKIGSNSMRNVVAAFVEPYKLLETKYNNRNFFSKIFRFGERAALNRVVQTMKKFLGGDLSDERAKELLDKMAKEMPSNKTRGLTEAVRNHVEPDKQASIVDAMLDPANALSKDERLNLAVENDRILDQLNKPQAPKRENVVVDIKENANDQVENVREANVEPVPEKDIEKEI